ncbi:hypothetical protein V6X42_18775 [Serratia marcescens]|uniref:hypothetical protein n=1 Tax=Serratia marcescens TaxID=615 RepID=UPI002FE691B3
MDNKLSELSKPVGFVSKQAQVLLKSGDTASVRPFFDVQGNSPLYSQEYVSALLAENERVASDLVARNGEIEGMKKRAAELEAHNARQTRATASAPSVNAKEKRRAAPL